MLVVPQPGGVVAGSYLAPSTVAAIRAAGIRVEQVPIARTVAEARVQVLYLARVVGQPQRGRILDARIAAARAAGRSG